MRDPKLVEGEVTARVILRFGRGTCARDVENAKKHKLLICKVRERRIA
jgi:hypothetical protein